MNIKRLMISLCLLPIYILLWPIVKIMGGPWTKYYDHITSFKKDAKPYCGYCKVPMRETNKWMHEYSGNHKWWCFLRRNIRNECIEWK